MIYMILYDIIGYGWLCAVVIIDWYRCSDSLGGVRVSQVCAHCAQSVLIF